MPGLRTLLVVIAFLVIMPARLVLAGTGDANAGQMPQGDIPGPIPTAIPTEPQVPGTASAPNPSEPPLPAWVRVRLPDGRTAWAPTKMLLIPSFAPQSPDRVVETARRLLGVPYRWGGETPNGVDCSGFVEEVFRLSGHRLPRMADAQFEACTQVPAESARPGDLFFFTTYLAGPSHVGIHLGDGSFIHASSSRGVTISSLKEDYYAQRFLGARRLPAWMPPAEPPPAGAAPPPAVPGTLNP